MEREFLVDGKPFTLKQILHENTHEDAVIDLFDIQVLIDAEIGEEFYIGFVHAKRIS